MVLPKYAFHLFAGAGGGILADSLLGFDTVGAVEIERYPREVLLSRQADGILPRFPIWDDVCSFTTENPECRGFIKKIKEISDELVISGGFPCQDISAAGKGKGLAGERSGLWAQMARIVGEIKPRFVFVENSPLLTGRGLDQVLLELATLGYDAEWGVLGAHHVGAPHKRDRIWILAHSLANTVGEGLEGLSWHGDRGDQPGRINQEEDRSISTSGIRWWDIDPADLPDTDEFNGHDDGYGTGQVFRERPKTPELSGSKDLPDTDQERYRQDEEERRDREEGDASREWWPVESRLGRVAHGVARRVDRLKAIGNGQVPSVAALAWITLQNRAEETAKYGDDK